MPGKRSKGQKLIAIPLDEDLLKLIDESRGHESRSAWVRAAIAGLLAEQGYNIPDGLARAPSRDGVGGRPKSTAAGNKVELLAEEEAEYKLGKKHKQKPNKNEI